MTTTTLRTLTNHSLYRYSRSSPQKSITQHVVASFFTFSGSSSSSSQPAVKTTKNDGDAVAVATKAKSYLENMIGNYNGEAAIVTNNNKRAPNSKIPSRNQLLLSGSSYLIPTFRIDRNDTPESIASRIKQNHDGEQQNDTIVKVRTPIVLDLQAWSPDGSPHYQPPATGSIQNLVEVLETYGFWIVGLVGNHTLPSTCQEEVVQMDLPQLFSKPARSGGVTTKATAGGGNKTELISLEHVISTMMVLQQQQNHDSDDDPNDMMYALTADRSSNQRQDEGHETDLSKRLIHQRQEDEHRRQSSFIPSDDVLKSITNTQLQDVLKTAGLPTSGTKSILVERINEGITNGTISAQHFQAWYRR